MSSQSDSHTHVVCLSGSTRFKREFLAAQLAESLRGRIVLLPAFSQTDGLSFSDAEIDALSDIHMRKIELSDEVFVINVGGYIGEQTAREVAHAESLGKAIRYWSHEAEIDPQIAAILARYVP